MSGNWSNVEIGFRLQQTMSRANYLLAISAIAAALLVGCGKKPDRLHQEALEAERSARQSYQEHDHKLARRAADRADAAASSLKKLTEANSQHTEDDQRKLAEAEAAARAAREFAEIAEEENARRELLGSLRVKAYQKARGALLGGLLPQMAAAAEAAGRERSNGSPAIESTLAMQSWKVASLLGAARPLSSGEPDWAGTAAQLTRWSTNEAVEFRAFLSLAFTLLGRSEFALAELEQMDDASLNGTNALAVYHGGRAFIYAMQGWNHLASQEAEKLSQVYHPSAERADGRMLVAVIHAVMAYEAGSKRQFLKMDSEIAQSLRAWPDNPILVFLTGEKLAANGEWEKAAESLETRAAGTQDEWVAKRLAQRARELRDGRGSTKAFAMDARFLLSFAAHGLATSVKNSEAGKKLQEAMEEARTFGQNLRQRLSLIGGS